MTQLACFLLLLLPIATVGLIALIRILNKAHIRKCELWLRGKRVLITGASNGIGEEVSKFCSRCGAHVILAARRPDKLTATKAACEALGASSVECVPCDVQDYKSCLDLAAAASTAAAPLDMVVLNAGVSMDFTFSEATLEGYSRLMQTNFFGPFWIAQKTLPSLVQSKGRLVLVSSTSAWLPRQRRALYSSSKAAATSLFENIRTEVSADGVSVTIAYPGFVGGTELAKGVSRLDCNGNSLLVAEGTADAAEKASSKGWRKILPGITARDCAQDIVVSAYLRKRDVAIPGWYSLINVFKVLLPSVYYAVVSKRKHKSD